MDTTTDYVIDSASAIYYGSMFLAAIYVWVESGSLIAGVLLSPFIALPFAIVAYVGVVALYFLGWLVKEVCRFIPPDRP